MSRGSALEYLIQAYEEFGVKAVAMAFHEHGPNADKFKVELRAIGQVIECTKEEAARVADLMDNSGRVGRAIRACAYST